MILLWSSKDVAYLGYWFAIWKQSAEFNSPITKPSCLASQAFYLFIVGRFFDLMEKKMGTYAAVEQNYLQKRRKNANPSGNTCPSLPLWIHLSFIWANIDKRFNTNYVSILSSLLGRVWGCQKHSRIRAECLHLTTQDKIPLLAYVEGKVTTIKRCLTNVLFVLNVHTILYVHSIYFKNNHYAIELINSIYFFAQCFCLVWIWFLF